MLQAKLPNGQYLIPSAALNATTATSLGYDAVVQGPNAQSNVDQGIAGIDYVVNDRDRMGIKYYVQNDPTTNPFGASGVLLGFPPHLSMSASFTGLSLRVLSRNGYVDDQHHAVEPRSSLQVVNG